MTSTLTSLFTKRENPSQKQQCRFHTKESLGYFSINIYLFQLCSTMFGTIDKGLNKVEVSRIT